MALLLLLFRLLLLLPWALFIWFRFSSIRGRRVIGGTTTTVFRQGLFGHRRKDIIILSRLRSSPSSFGKLCLDDCIRFHQLSEFAGRPFHQPSAVIFDFENIGGVVRLALSNPDHGKIGRKVACCNSRSVWRTVHGLKSRCHCVFFFRIFTNQSEQGLSALTMERNECQSECFFLRPLSHKQGYWMPSL